MNKKMGWIGWLAFVIVVALWCLRCLNGNIVESTQPKNKAVTIDNPITRSIPQEKVGWATATSTPSGVLIRASVKVGFEEIEKGGTE